MTSYKKHLINLGVVLLSFITLFCTACAQAQDVSEMYPAELDPLVGNWTGRWSAEEEVNPDISAQVVSLGRGKYQIRLATKLFMRCPVLALIETTAKDGVISFNEQGYQGEIRDGKFTGARRTGKMTFEMTKFFYESPTMGAAPPEGAVVLFDGTTFDAWENASGWVLTGDGAMMVTPEAGDLVSKGKYKDLHMHVEFRTPFQPKERGQGRGNSGVFVQDVYEIQVLDSFGLEGTYDECGALYKVSAPYVNAALPPTHWQTYDIAYRAPRFNDDGSVKEYPRMTVLHNGYVIQKDQEIPQITAWKENERLQPPPAEPGAIKLQSHNSHYVQYRNIWLVIDD